MLSDSMKSSLKAEIAGKVLFDESMRNHTSFAIGGIAEALVTPNDQFDLSKVLQFARVNSVPVTIIGNGTNLLVSDAGIDGVVIKIAGCLDDMVINDDKVLAGAGCLLSGLVKKIASAGLEGIEFLIGIPGTVGGAVITNAGAGKKSMADILQSVEVIDLQGQIKRLNREELSFDYRSSSLQGENTIILNAELVLKKGNINKIKESISNNMKLRLKKQPVKYASAGSIFKNPENDYAGRLIELSGLKGMRKGDAQVSDLHANFIINRGDALASDVLYLIEEIQKVIFSRFGINLELEINLIGKAMKI